MTKCRINPLAAGLALGVMWGFSMLLLGLLLHFGVEGGIVTSLRAQQANTDMTVAGVFMAVLVGFIDGFVRGAVLALLYNLFAGCCCSKKDSSCA